MVTLSREGTVQAVSMVFVRAGKLWQHPQGRKGGQGVQLTDLFARDDTRVDFISGPDGLKFVRETDLVRTIDRGACLFFCMHLCLCISLSVSVLFLFLFQF